MSYYCNQCLQAISIPKIVEDFLSFRGLLLRVYPARKTAQVNETAPNY